MEIKLKKPSKESIKKAIIEVISNNFNESFFEEITTVADGFTINQEFCSKDILNRAEYIENFGECGSSNDDVAERLLKRINHIIENKLLNDKLSKDLNDILNNQLINGVALTEKYIEENYQYSDLMITRLIMADYKFAN